MWLEAKKGRSGYYYLQNRDNNIKEKYYFKSLVGI